VCLASITTERDHQIKVQFAWQRGQAPLAGGLTETGSQADTKGNAPGNETSGTWVRVAEALAGANWGTNFTPRLRSEVVVDFIEGDMDRPLVIAQLDNGSDLPPYQGKHMSFNLHFKRISKKLISIALLIFCVARVVHAEKTNDEVRPFSRFLIADYVGLMDRQPDDGPIFMYYTDYAKFLQASGTDEIEVWGITEKGLFGLRSLAIGPPAPRNESGKAKKSDFMLPEEMKPAADWEYRYRFATYDNTIDVYKGDGDTDHYSKEFRPWLKPVMVDLRIFDKEAQELSPLTKKKTGRQVVKVGRGHVLITPGTPYKVNGVLQMHEEKYGVLNANEFIEEGFDRKFIVLYYFSSGQSRSAANLLQDGDLKIGAKHSDPIRPFIIADYDLSDAGTVLRGKAMCVADCPQGKLFRLLKKGDNLFH
jgi:hypothetical protein